MVEKELKIVGCRRKDLAGRRSRENMLKNLVLGVVGRGIGDFFAKKEALRIPLWRRGGGIQEPSTLEF